MQLVIASKMDRSFTSDIERGAIIPTLKKVDAIAKVFKISFSDLFIGV